MDANIPVRAWKLTMDHIDLINADVANFKAVNDKIVEFCEIHETLPVLGIDPPYTMVLAGFKTEIKGTEWNEGQQRYEPIRGTPSGDWLLKTMAGFRAPSVIFEKLGIDHIVNVGMPQNTMCVAPDFSDLPILIMFGAYPGHDMGFGVEGLVELPTDEAQALARWMETAE